MVYSFYFLCFGSRRNECNSLFGEKKGEKSEDCGLFWYCLRYAVMMIRWYRQLPLYTINIKAISLIFISDGDWLLYWYSLRQGAHLPSKQEPFWPLPLIPPKDYCTHSFWSQNTEKRNNTISQMRLRSVFKMRISILNTATTEQMGYGIISFFVCFPLMNQIVNFFFFRHWF